MNNSEEFGDLLLTLTTNILLPCLPIFIERLVVFMQPALVAPFPNRDIIVIAFLIPIVWITKISSKVMLVFCAMFILFAAVPFVLSITDPSPRVYWSGFVLALSSIVVFSSFEIRRYLTRIQVRNSEEVEI